MYSIRMLANFTAEVRRVMRGGSPTHARLRDRLVGLAVTTIGFDLICGVLAFLFERDQSGSQIRSFGGAIFWTSTQLLTVSSNLRNPISTPAHVLDVFMEIYAITIIGTLAAAVGAFLIRHSEELDAAARRAEHDEHPPATT